MPTTKHRINITTDKDVERALTRSAKRDGIPLASKAGHLLRIALELEEDLALIDMAEKRAFQKNIKYVSHAHVWG